MRMITKIRHTGIVVEDLDKALEFYRDVLEFKVEKSMNERGPFIETILGLKGVVVTTIKMSAPDGSFIELLCYILCSYYFYKKIKKCSIYDSYNLYRYNI